MKRGANAGSVRARAWKIRLYMLTASSNIASSKESWSNVCESLQHLLVRCLVLLIPTPSALSLSHLLGSAGWHSIAILFQVALAAAISISPVNDDRTPGILQEQVGSWWQPGILQEKVGSWTS